MDDMKLEAGLHGATDLERRYLGALATLAEVRVEAEKIAKRQGGNIHDLVTLLAAPDTAALERRDKGMRVYYDIKVERTRQIEKGWTPEHDDEHGVAHLVEQTRGRIGELDYWLREPDLILPTRQQLIQVAALAVAAIEVMDRSTSADASDGDTDE